MQEGTPNVATRIRTVDLPVLILHISINNCNCTGFEIQKPSRKVIEFTDIFELSRFRVIMFSSKRVFEITRDTVKHVFKDHPLQVNNLVFGHRRS